MAATIDIRVYTSTNAATESGVVTGVDFISADNATNSLANRTTNPITAGDNSFEKWIKAKCSVAPDNEVDNFKVWGDASVDTNTTLNVGFTATGATPTASASSTATTDFTTYTSGAKGTWDDSSSLTAIDDMTKYMVFQLVTTGSATAGDWSQETINYSYDEK